MSQDHSWADKYYKDDPSPNGSGQEGKDQSAAMPSNDEPARGRTEAIPAEGRITDGPAADPTTDELLREVNEWIKRVEENRYSSMLMWASLAVRLRDRIVELNRWADKFSDAQVKERLTGEHYQRELREKIDRLQLTCDDYAVHVTALRAQLADRPEQPVCDSIDPCRYAQNLSMEIEKLQTRLAAHPPNAEGKQ